MKRFFVSFAAAVVAMAFAASANAQISVGAGFGHMTRTGKAVSGNISEKIDPVGLSGFYVNGNYTFSLLSKNWGELALQPGLTYQFGANVEREEEAGIKGKRTISEHYLDIPVNVRYSYDIKPGTIKLHAYAGPVLSFGLASIEKAKVELEEGWLISKTNLYTGKYSIKSTDKSMNETGKSDEASGYSFFDLKLGIGLGATIEDKYEVKIGYNFGLLNRTAGMNVDSDNKFISRTHVLQIGVGYNF